MYKKLIITVRERNDCNKFSYKLLSIILTDRVFRSFLCEYLEFRRKVPFIIVEEIEEMSVFKGRIKIIAFIPPLCDLCVCICMYICICKLKFNPLKA